jgi:hypothetical protein
MKFAKRMFLDGLHVPRPRKDMRKILWTTRLFRKAEPTNKFESLMISYPNVARVMSKKSVLRILPYISD